MAKPDKQAEATVDATSPEVAEAVPVVEFAGLSIRLDAFFISPVTRDVVMGAPGEVFRFEGGVPRQLPARVFAAAISHGITVAE